MFCNEKLPFILSQKEEYTSNDVSTYINNTWMYHHLTHVHMAIIYAV